MLNSPVQQGDVAPDFELLNQDKHIVRLSQLRGKKVVLVFYPMDFSPVCAQELPKIGQIETLPDTVVFGINTDTPYAHAAFKKQCGIPYDLLSDPTRRVVKAYGMFAGEAPYNCAKRGTVVIDERGQISLYKEEAMCEPRKVEELAKVVRGN